MFAKIRHPVAFQNEIAWCKCHRVLTQEVEESTEQDHDAPVIRRLWSLHVLALLNFHCIPIIC